MESEALRGPRHYRGPCARLAAHRAPGFGSSHRRAAIRTLRVWSGRAVTLMTLGHPPAHAHRHAIPPYGQACSHSAKRSAHAQSLPSRGLAYLANNLPTEQRYLVIIGSTSATEASCWPPSASRLGTSSVSEKLSKPGTAAANAAVVTVTAVGKFALLVPSCS